MTEAKPADSGSKFTGEWIWGDEQETEVYAQGYGASLTVIFRFKRYPHADPTSLASRIVVCYHDLLDESDDEPDGDSDHDHEGPSITKIDSMNALATTSSHNDDVAMGVMQVETIWKAQDNFRTTKLRLDGPQSSFANREAMRKSLWFAVDTIWPDVIMTPTIKAASTVVDVDGHGEGPFDWRPIHHPCFPQYLECLRTGEGSVSTLSILKIVQLTSIPGPGFWTQEAPYTVKFEDLIRYNQLGGRGCATKVQHKDDSSRFFVFKGLDFRTFLMYSDGEGDEMFKLQVKRGHHANNVVAVIPPHPRILQQPETVVVIGSSQVTCGCLYKYYSKGDLGTRLEAAYEQGAKLPTHLKKRWCFQMAQAIHHTHYAAKSYHMDIKPGNFLIDDEDNLILIDWEQSDAPATTLAPEADGTWDVEQVSEVDEASSRLLYKKYMGPERSNVDKNAPGSNTWNTWNVFPLWSKDCPRALELAEVFSLGRSMWMVLRQPEMEWDEIEHPTDVVTDWDSAHDIPSSWRETVDQCLAEDPNQRPDLNRLLGLIQAWC